MEKIRFMCRFLSNAPAGIAPHKISMPWLNKKRGYVPRFA
jgi:hypothetical protein